MNFQSNRSARNPVWHRWLALLAGLVFGWAALGAASGIPVMPVMATSRSGQFIVHGRETRLPPAGGDLKAVGQGEMISLRPELLAVTCERIRQTVKLRMGATDRAGSRVHLYLRSRHKVESQLTILPQLIREGWLYHLELPEEVEWKRLVRALVEVVLLDEINRTNQGDTCVLPPLWLAEGVTELLLNEFGRDLVPESQTTLNRNSRRLDPLGSVRSTLAGNNPLGFTELGLPELNQLADPAVLGHFRASATLFVSELLRDSQGPLWLREFLQQLPRHLNWQTAFLRASGGTFSTLLDVEKWWAVSAASVLSRDPSLHWPRERVLSELELILTETADLRAATNAPAARRTLPLSELVRTWEFEAQKEVLQRKVNQLRLLSVHAPQELLPLVIEIHRTLDDYITARAGAGRNGPARMDLAPRGRMLAQSAARKLEELDRAVAQARAKQGK
jgi:hypothetical protein